MEFSRQEHWSGLPCPPPGDLSDPGMLSTSLMSPALAGRLEVHMLSRFSRVRPCATPWSAAHQAPLSMGFSRQEHWSGLPCPLRVDPGSLMSPISPYWQAGSLPLAAPGKPLLSRAGRFLAHLQSTEISGAVGYGFL